MCSSYLKNRSFLIYYLQFTFIHLRSWHFFMFHCSTYRYSHFVKWWRDRQSATSSSLITNTWVPHIFLLFKLFKNFNFPFSPPPTKNNHAPPSSSLIFLYSYPKTHLFLSHLTVWFTTILHYFLLPHCRDSNDTPPSGHQARPPYIGFHLFAYNSWVTHGKWQPPMPYSPTTIHHRKQRVSNKSNKNHLHMWNRK